MSWRRVYDGQPSLLKQRDGYSVRLYNPNGLRYFEGGCEMTLLAEFVDETEELGKRLFILPTLVKAVYVPSTLTWDDGTLLSQEKAAVVLDRIRSVLAETHKHYHLAVNDEMYEAARRASEKAERDAMK